MGSISDVFHPPTILVSLAKELLSASFDRACHLQAFEG